MKHRPQTGWMIVEREMQPKSVIIPETSEATSDEVFRIVKLGDKSETSDLSLRTGDLVFVVGYISKVTFKGQNIILARQKDVVVVLKED